MTLTNDVDIVWTRLVVSSNYSLLVKIRSD